MCKSSGSLSHQKVMQQSLEINMLNIKLETLRKQHMQLTDVHSKCKSQKENSRSISESDDQV